MRDFLSENLNIIIYQDVHILHSQRCIYICDDMKNYMKIFDSTIHNAIIQEIMSYNKMITVFNNIFAEVLVGDIVFDSLANNIFYNYNSNMLYINNKFAVYNNKKIYKLDQCRTTSN